MSNNEDDENEDECIECCKHNAPCVISCIFVCMFLCCAVSGILCISEVSYGCYENNGVELCPNWNDEIVTYTEYGDMTLTITPNCNCNDCTTSNMCDCNQLECYVYGEYDKNTQCTITYDYGLDGYDKKIKYRDIHKYKIGEAEKYYVNTEKFDGYCMLSHEVEKVGDGVYVLFVVSIVSFAIFFSGIVFVCIQNLC
jgi:hypothetical protein